MGKIHDALQRAEQERAALGGAPGGPAAAEEAPAPKRATRAERLREARRTRVMVNGLESGVTEEFRSLRARIQSIRRTRKIRSIVVTSAVPREGKTTTATNLALSFGLEREGRACLVDADLRLPSVHRALVEAPDVGLAELLEADAKLEEALVEIPNTRLSVLPVRSLPAQPSELLASRKMAELMDELHTRFGTVLIDAPPINGLPDATELVDLCDAALLVVLAGKTARTELDRALQRIDRTKVIGTVFNRSREKTTPYGSYYKR